MVKTDINLYGNLQLTKDPSRFAAAAKALRQFLMMWYHALEAEANLPEKIPQGDDEQRSGKSIFISCVNQIEGSIANSGYEKKLT